MGRTNSQLKVSAIRQDDPQARSGWYLEAMEHLVSVIQELSAARDLETIAAIVREAARSLTGADGASFVLRDGDNCFYVDENAISPLWKGLRFPMSNCVSGWVMLNARPAVIPDIYADERVPVDAYKPTFVRSLAMVPIRRHSPIGAIGNYWACHRLPTPEEIDILQALADTTSVALENAQLYVELQKRLSDLERSNFALSRFAWVASHDMQEPLRTIATQVEMLERRNAPQLDEKSLEYVHTAAEGAHRLQNLMDDLLVYASVDRIDRFEEIDMSRLVAEVVDQMKKNLQECGAEVTCESLPIVVGDGSLLVRVMQNLISNAIKFRRRGVPLRIHVSCECQDGKWVFSVRDNGIGMDPAFHEQVFELFRRLHTRQEYPGSGIGLAMCRRIIELHGGKMNAKSRPGEGSIFTFTLPERKNIEIRRVS